MGKFDPFIPLAKQVGNKIKRRNPGLKVPSWYEAPVVSKPSGNFNPGSYQEGGKAPARGQFNPGGYQERDVQKPSGAFNPGGYKDEPRYPDTDPYGNYYFALELSDGEKNGMEVAHFQECSGLKNSATLFEIEEGGLNAKSHKRPGQGKWENLVLKYASSSSTLLLSWRDDWLTGTDNWKNRTKYSGAVTLRNNAGEVVKRYEFRNAWPVSWEGPAFNGGSSDLAVETLEIAHDGLVIKDA